MNHLVEDSEDSEDGEDGFCEIFFGYPVSMLPGQEREDASLGGKIILPPSALEALNRRDVSYPMLFKLSNPESGRVSHCGVLEFIADEERAYFPRWMMSNLSLPEGGTVRVESATLPLATFCRFRPLSVDFLDIHNHRAVLENTLRWFTCLTSGDIISIGYNRKNYEISVFETEPGNAVSIIECDLKVEFAPPEGYVEPEPERVKEEEEQEEFSTSFEAFGGAGHRPDGKEKEDGEPPAKRRKMMRGIPDYDWAVGTLDFLRVERAKRPPVREDDAFEPFSGQGKPLK